MGTSKVWGAPLVQGHAPFSFACDIMMVLCIPGLRAKFEVAGTNIIGQPQNFGSFRSSKPRPLFLWV